jgi:hypothetical protein
MVKIEQRGKIECDCVIRLTEPEMRALDAIVGYGWDGFIKTFKQHMGQSYIRDHEAGGKLLFETVRSLIPSILRRVDQAREVFDGEKLAISHEAQERFHRLIEKERADKAPQGGGDDAAQ